LSKSKGSSPRIIEVAQTGHANGVHGRPALLDDVQIFGSDNRCSQEQANEGNHEMKPNIES
jgi:hypothetical protein